MLGETLPLIVWSSQNYRRRVFCRVYRVNILLEQKQ